ncbi:MAG TPA: carbohydrate ABC transporter permease [Actinophytocola sp.]|uniref:carbohydrate ABC transporter permease n=1 Tax=Actinophytocola sp. TaxID=1872138 RepID=UPI002DDC9C20|nr:carbohydrate ABC transporter permease [Actinophytocola sp.]HEV2782531.1 carbohydrate ABC transporter permease [Actinophytocola sp.]
MTRPLRTALFHGWSAALAIAFLFPLLWALLNSLKTTDEANQQPPTWFPHSLSLDNYRNLTTFDQGIGTYLVNSILVSAITVIGSVVVCVLGGYGFARFTFRGKSLLFGSTLAILMVPYATILLPLYILLSRIGLGNTLLGLALVLVMFQLPFGIFLMRNSFEAIPRELEEAALVDGCSSFGAFRHVSLRIVLPGAVTVALFSFLTSWNEYLAPLIFLNDGSKYTLPVMLVNIRYASYNIIDFGALQAGIVIAMVPCLVVYLLLQRFYVSGLVAGALRG